MKKLAQKRNAGDVGVKVRKHLLLRLPSFYKDTPNRGGTDMPPGVIKAKQIILYVFVNAYICFIVNETNV